MKVFKDVELDEQLGSGMVRILKVYDRNIFDINDNYIKITFKFTEMNNSNKGDSNESQWSRK